MSRPLRRGLLAALLLLAPAAARAQGAPDGVAPSETATASGARAAPGPAPSPVGATKSSSEPAVAPDAGVSPPKAVRRPEPEPEPEPVRGPRRARRRTSSPSPSSIAVAVDAGVMPEPAAAPDAGGAILAPSPPEPTPSSGWTFWDVGPPAQAEGPSAFDQVVERLDAALWPVVQVLVSVFLLLRLLSWLVARLARRGRENFILLQRGWVFVEGTVWLLAGSWAAFELSAREGPSATLLALVAFAVLVALSWNGLRDIAAGLMIAAERPFALGDHVTLSEGEGVVRAFRSRVLELEAKDGLRIRVPYRRVLGAARVRKGGRQTSHAVQLELDVGDSLEPQEALQVARELAASSPWAVLSLAPRLELVQVKGSSRVRLVAFAFDVEAKALLHADLLAGWREAAKRSAEGRSGRA